MPTPRPWPLTLRILFRFVFAYFAQFTMASGHKTIWEKIPRLGHPLQSLLEHPYLRAAQWHATHVFHLTVRAADNTLWGGGTYYPESADVILLSPLRQVVPYHLTQPDPTHLILISPSAPTLQFIRIPLPATYQLQHRSFHFFNEWGYEH